MGLSGKLLHVTAIEFTQIEKRKPAPEKIELSLSFH